MTFDKVFRNQIMILAKLRELRTAVLLLTFLFFGKAGHALATDDGATPFDTLIRSLGLYDSVCDYSDSQQIIIDKPTCTYINITGCDAMPKSKEQLKNIYMDIYTSDGNHFRKRAVISAQGNSSMLFPKKNFKADFCEDEWLGEVTTSFSIGEWVKQDAFHFNAYYVDFLRGIGVVGYQLYDQIALNSGRPWTRALDHIANPKKKARCYPDGFPAVVYLNGSFYGIFAWQLKKHHKNMNMKKEEATHIHLDGKIGIDTFWGLERLKWDLFEVRNPKRLYTMDGQPYDGDNPCELMDENSEFYLLATDDEATKADKLRTALVKKSIEALSGYFALVEDMRLGRKGGPAASPGEIRSFIEKHFDVTSMIDYACFHFTVNNYDGFRNNWQWFTYDGEKWFVAPYDLDNTFGNWYSGVTPPEKLWDGGGAPWDLFSIFGPFYWLSFYYAEDIKNRYFELRESGIIDSGNIIGLLEQWYYSVDDFYDDEWRRWPESQCITAYHDSLGRYKEWITRRIDILDNHFGYRSSDQHIVSPTAVPPVTAIYDAAGHKLDKPRKGLMLYRHADGSTRKRIVKSAESE